MILKDVHMKTVKLTYHDFKLLYEYFEQQQKMPGFSHRFSAFLLKNLEYMQDNNEVIDKNIQASFAQHEVYGTRLNALKEKYADRGSQGEIIMNGSEPSITEQILEFDEAVAALKKEMPNCDVAFNVLAFLAEKEIIQELYLYDSFEDYPEQLPPVILEALFKLS